jgi:hypothetical protein
MTQLERYGNQIFEVLQGTDGQWLKRKDIAKRLGKKRLQAQEIFGLELLQIQGKIRARLTPTNAPTGQRFEYSAAENAK